jgi:hypothetical protein
MFARASGESLMRIFLRSYQTSLAIGHRVLDATTDPFENCYDRITEEHMMSAKTTMLVGYGDLGEASTMKHRSTLDLHSFCRI